MNTQWIVETHGDPLGAVRRFVHAVWQRSHLDGMLVPLNGGESAGMKVRVLNDPWQLGEINPFKPLMTINAAKLVPEVLQRNTEVRLGAMLRPCEKRALTEMVKHDSFKINGLLTICVDCLGTFPAEEYQWRAQRKEARGGLTQEALQFARQGGIVPYRYRSACQTCSAPQAEGADLNIGVIGLPVRQYILVNARNEATAERLQLDVITDGAANPALVAQREHTIARLLERHRFAHQHLTDSLADILPANVDEVVRMLAKCDLCQACLNVCPICAVDFPQRGEDGNYRREDVKRWLVSCAGCGMCEQACPNHMPLSAIFGQIREQLAEQVDYVPGHSTADPLPVV